MVKFDKSNRSSIKKSIESNQSNIDPEIIESYKKQLEESEQKNNELVKTVEQLKNTYIGDVDNLKNQFEIYENKNKTLQRSINTLEEVYLNDIAIIKKQYEAEIKQMNDLYFKLEQNKNTNEEEKEIKNKIEGLQSQILKVQEEELTEKKKKNKIKKWDLLSKGKSSQSLK